jgi:cell division septation protein DedD
MARRDRGQFQFTVVELTVLAMSFAATSALVFLLGFYVGRENASQHAPLDERVARIPVGSAPHEDATAESESVRPGDAAALFDAVAPSGGELGSDKSPLEPGDDDAAIEKESREPAPRIAGIPYTVQVLATRNQREAETLRAKLAAGRIGAFVTEVEEAGVRWYRVRIGRYDDFESARVMQERVRRDFGLGQAYVVPYRRSAR